MWAVKKAMGLKKGERVLKLARIRVVSTRAEKIGSISAPDVEREGFPGMTSMEFVDMFCRHMRCDAGTTVNRIEFEYVRPARQSGFSGMGCDD